MSMEHLVLGLVLLAATLAAGNPQFFKSIEEKVLDMVPNSFDDQYRGCRRMMEEELGELNRTEFAKNSIYATYWTRAVAEWQKKGAYVPKLPGLRAEHAVALMAYSMETPLYKVFNKAVREAGSSLTNYLENFDFKALHFLLTQALRILWDAQPRQCYQVYRGIRDIRFTAQTKDVVRFGQFASSSRSEDIARKIFGQDTFFSVYTCYGVPLGNLSAIPNEKEVLIPPFETFEVTSITHTGARPHIHLQYKNISSNYNCEWIKEKRCKDQPCDFSAGRTIIGDPRLLWGLLLAATALAATGGP